MCASSPMSFHFKTWRSGEERGLCSSLSFTLWLSTQLALSQHLMLTRLNTTAHHNQRTTWLGLTTTLSHSQLEVSTLTLSQKQEQLTFQCAFYFWVTAGACRWVTVAFGISQEVPLWNSQAGNWTRNETKDWNSRMTFKSTLLLCCLYQSPWLCCC